MAKPQKNKHVAFCWRNGVIQIGTRLPAHALPIGRVDEQALRIAVDVLARHGYKRGVRLVPGVPEAKTGDDAVDAVVRFEIEFKKRIGDPRWVSEMLALEAEVA